MKSILTFLLIILMDIQFNYACPCNPTNTLIEMNESFASQFQTATIIPMFLWQPSWSYPIEGLAIGLLISLIVYYRMVYSTKLFPHEKLRLILNITHKNSDTANFDPPPTGRNHFGQSLRIYIPKSKADTQIHQSYYELLPEHCGIRR